jgi:AsmA protein
MKTLKWVLYGVGALILVIVAAAVFFVATFDPNGYKPRIVELVKQQTGRTLTVDGRIELTFFPKIGAAVGKATLSEPNSATMFARVDSAHVAVALLPLLSRQVIVDRVTLTGLAVDLVRYKDGRTNFDDLTGHAAKPGKPADTPRQTTQRPPLAVDVGGIVMQDTTIGWRDEGDGTNVRLSNVTLKTGRLASRLPGKLELAARVEGAQPKASLQFNMETGYRIDLETPAVALSSLDVKVAGNARGLTGIEARLKGEAVDLDSKAQRVTLSRVELTAKSKDGLDAKVAIPRLELAPDHAESQAIAAEVTLATPPRTVSAKVQIAPLAAKGKQIQPSRLDVDLTAKQGDLAVQGKLATPVTVDLERQQAELPGLAGDLTVSGKNIPDKSKATVNGSARADWRTESASADLVVKLDDSNIDAKVAVAHWREPIITFNVVADRLNVDRYLPPSKPDAAQGGRPAGGAPAAGGGARDEQPFDLSPLKSLNAMGHARIGALQVSNVKAEQIALTIKAAGGRLDIHPISATLYQGALAGSAAVNANDRSFTVKQQLSGVNVGPLLRDATDKDLLEGRGAVTLDVMTTGTTVTALKKALTGSASLALKDGALKGIDIAGAIRAAQAMLGSKSALEEQARSGAKTDFTELTASFVIKNGVAHNDDLQAKSPLLRLVGRGDIDVGEGTMDYTARASLVVTATGQRGQGLGQLAGVTVPVHATGPLAKLTYSVDLQSLATELATGAVQREIERRVGGGKAGSQQGSGLDAVGNALRELLGKPR